MSVKTDLFKSTDSESKTTLSVEEVSNVTVTGQSKKHTTNNKNTNNQETDSRKLDLCVIDGLSLVWDLAPACYGAADLPRHLYRCRLDR